VRFKAQFPNPDFALFPDQFVNARLLVDTLRDVVLVPAAAVQRSPTSTFVYVVKPDATVDMRNVVIGPTEADETVIESGLAAGENVVTDGVDKLQQGTKVTISGGGKGGDAPGDQSRAYEPRVDHPAERRLLHTRIPSPLDNQYGRTY